MTALASVVVAVALADLRHGLTGEPRSVRAAGEATVVALVAALFAAALTGQTDRATALIVVLATVLVGGWSDLRRRRAPARWPLAYLAGGLVAAVVLDSRVGGAAGGSWTWIWGDMKLAAFNSVGDEQAALIIAMALFLTATGNSIVRLVLALDGVRMDEAPADEVKGGRVIGPIERLVIFGALIAGAATIAGFVVAAKSLLRFPELSEKSRIHEATEYVLIGSLASWGVALLASLIAA